MIRLAAANGSVPVTFDTTCHAGGYTRNFSGKGVLRVSTARNTLQICGEHGFITQVYVNSEEEAVDYIMHKFNAFELNAAYASSVEQPEPALCPAC